MQQLFQTNVRLTCFKWGSLWSKSKRKSRWPGRGDASGASVPKATVTLTQSERSLKTTVQTDSAIRN